MTEKDLRVNRHEPLGLTKGNENPHPQGGDGLTRAFSSEHKKNIPAHHQQARWQENL